MNSLFCALLISSLPIAQEASAQASSDPVLFSAADGRLLAPTEAAQRVASAQIVYVGEEHDQTQHHQAQADVLAALADAGTDVVLGLEMIDVTHQAAFDAAIASGSEEQLKAAWSKSWTLYDAYRPVLLAALKRRIRLVALNAPRTIVSQAAKNGLDSLKPAERALLTAEIAPTQNPFYYEYLKKTLEESGHGGPDALKRFVFGMQIWNETMAENLLKQRQAGKRVVMIAGYGHLIYRGGVIESVARRAPSERQLMVLPYPLRGRRAALPDLVAELSDSSTSASKQADLFWLLPQSPSLPPSALPALSSARSIDVLFALDKF